MFKALSAVLRENPGEFLGGLLLTMLLGGLLALATIGVFVARSNGTRNERNDVIEMKLQQQHALDVKKEKDNTFNQCVQETHRTTDCAVTVYGLVKH